MFWQGSSISLSFPSSSTTLCCTICAFGVRPEAIAELKQLVYKTFHASQAHGRPYNFTLIKDEESKNRLFEREKFKTRQFFNNSSSWFVRLGKYQRITPFHSKPCFFTSDVDDVSSQAQEQDAEIARSAYLSPIKLWKSFSPSVV